MKRKILITGENSYIGNNLKNWLDNKNENIEVVKKNVRGDKWKEINFSYFDTIIHVAGIAHMKEKSVNINSYYEVNRDLSFNIAKKAKTSEVKQFIFLSSMSVYGAINGEINFTTEPKPTTDYGKSKLEAEHLIKNLEDISFKVAILRPPMVYGENCKGNYNSLSKLAQKVPFFPSFDNKRSMIHGDNLSEFIYLVIKYNDSGIFFPQNEELICTSKMVRNIGEYYNKDIKMIQFMNSILKFLITKNKTINKVFGDLYYKLEISKYKENYNFWNFKESIDITEGGKIEK